MNTFWTELNRIVLPPAQSLLNISCRWVYSLQSDKNIKNYNIQLRNIFLFFIYETLERMDIFRPFCADFADFSLPVNHSASNAVQTKMSQTQSACLCFRLLWKLMLPLLLLCMLLVAVLVLLVLAVRHWLQSTRNARRAREGRPTVAFFHPYCNAGGGGERVLWCAIRALQNR